MIVRDNNSITITLSDNIGRIVLEKKGQDGVGYVVSDVWVSPSYRGKHLGRLLLRAAMSLGAMSAIVLSEAGEKLFSAMGWIKVEGSTWQIPFPL